MRGIRSPAEEAWLSSITETLRTWSSHFVFVAAMASSTIGNRLVRSCTTFPAPPSRDRVHDDSIRVGPWAIAIARPAIRGCAGDRWSGWRDITPDVPLSSSASNDGSSNRRGVFAPMDFPANPASP